MQGLPLTTSETRPLEPKIFTRLPRRKLFCSIRSRRKRRGGESEKSSVSSSYRSTRADKRSSRRTSSSVSLLPFHSSFEISPSTCRHSVSLRITADAVCANSRLYLRRSKRRRAPGRLALVLAVTVIFPFLLVVP